MNESKYLLKDTFDFVNKVKLFSNTKVGMGSFDFESLFTNVTLEEKIDILVEKIFIICQITHKFRNLINFFHVCKIK